jgi:hypothetical protein
MTGGGAMIFPLAGLPPSYSVLAAFRKSAARFLLNPIGIASLESL